ncbi:MAG: hypothetical protein HYY62_01475, partial [Deltaproteobacteria bacterium]|nr:hypothetical protein [Deltaproteobacteria bacterium]
MTKKILTFFLLWIPAFAGMTCTNLFAQDAPPSIFDEGVETTIRPEDIGEDVKLWAQNTALKFKKLLSQIKKLSVSEKRNLMLKTIQESVEEAQGKRELLLMRFSLNRALRLEQEFRQDDDALVLNHILLPAVKQAITLYEQSDLPYLEANRGKPEGEIEPPPYAAYTKINIGYLLNASNMNKTLEGQFHILELSLAWVGNDLLRSPKARRNSINADLILRIQNILEELKSTPPDQITYGLNNKLRTTLLEMAKEIVSEAQTQMTPPLTYNPESISKDLVFPEASIESKSSDSNFDLSFLRPHAGILRCHSDIDKNGHNFDNVLNVGAIVPHVSSNDGRHQDTPSLKIICEDVISGTQYHAVLFGLGLGAIYSGEWMSLEYFGFGSPVSTYFGPRVSAAALLVGTDLGVLTNGRMVIT